MSFPKTNLHYFCRAHLFSEVRLICVCLWLQYRWLGTFLISILEGFVWNMVQGSFSFLFFCPPYWCNTRNLDVQIINSVQHLSQHKCHFLEWYFLEFLLDYFALFLLCTHITLFVFLSFTISLLFRVLF